MKKQITILMALVILSSNAFAQGTSKAKAEENTSIKGFRVSAATLLLDGEIKYSREGASGSYTTHFDQAFGVSLGYANLPIQELGWTANASYIEIQDSGTTVGLVRADGNLAYAFTNILSIKGGLNISKFVTKNFASLNSGIGAQAGLGIQLTKNFGLDVGSSFMSQSGNMNDANIEIKEAGFEIGLNGTF